MPVGVSSRSINLSLECMWVDNCPAKKSHLVNYDKAGQINLFMCRFCALVWAPNTMHISEINGPWTGGIWPVVVMFPITLPPGRSERLLKVTHSNTITSPIGSNTIPPKRGSQYGKYDSGSLRCPRKPIPCHILSTQTALLAYRSLFFPFFLFVSVFC